jgi:hypothetical protein
MHRHYLSYQLALSFHRSVACLADPDPVRKHELLRSAETLIHEFALSIRSRDSKQARAKLLVTLLAARDCGETLIRLPSLEGVDDLKRQWGVLHDRLEGLCLEASEAEHGQLRMLG